MTWQAWVLGLVGVLGGLGGLAALLALPVQLRKGRADAAAVIVDSAVDLLEPLKAEIREVKGELLKVERLVRQIKTELSRPSPSVQRLRDIVGLGSD